MQESTPTLEHLPGITTKETPHPLGELENGFFGFGHRQSPRPANASGKPLGMAKGIPAQPLGNLRRAIVALVGCRIGTPANSLTAGFYLQNTRFFKIYNNHTFLTENYDSVYNNEYYASICYAYVCNKYSNFINDFTQGAQVPRSSGHTFRSVVRSLRSDRVSLIITPPFGSKRFRHFALCGDAFALSMVDVQGACLEEYGCFARFAGATTQRSGFSQFFACRCPSTNRRPFQNFVKWSHLEP